MFHNGTTRCPTVYTQQHCVAYLMIYFFFFGIVVGVVVVVQWAGKLLK